MGQLGNLSPAAGVAVGVLVGLLSTSIQSIGLTLQRKSHLLEDEKEDELVRRPPYRRRRWQIGMFMFIISNLVGSTIQITTLPLPVLSTLQASGLVFNTICATLLLGEAFTKWSLIGTILVAAGAILIGLFGALPEPSHNLDQLLDLLQRPQFIIWMLGTGFIIFAILILALILSRLRHHNTPRIRLFLGMCFGSVSAILSSHSLLVAKSAVELIVRTISDGHNQFKHWQSWMILLVLCFFALSQLYFLHRGLKLCSTSVLYPFVFCIYNIVAILDGLIYFRQTDRLPPLHAGLIAVGTVILLAGVLALSWRLQDEGHGGPPPPDAHSLLTPGMGIVEDTTTEESATSSPLILSDDEEAILHNSETTPLLEGKTRLHRNLTSTTKDNAILKATKQRCMRLATDVDEIWSALQDDDAQRSPSIRRVRPASTLPITRLEGSDDESALAGDEASGVKPLRRARTVAIGRDGARTGGRNEWRERRRRQWSKQYRRASMPLSLPSQDLGIGIMDESQQRPRPERRPTGNWLTEWWRTRIAPAG